MEGARNEVREELVSLTGQVNTLKGEIKNFKWTITVVLAVAAIVIAIVKIIP